MRFIVLLFSMVLTQQLEVEGDLKVTGNIDASNQRITNVAEPVLTSDVATAHYVDLRSAGNGRIIELKCPWVSPEVGNNIGVSSCEPPSCPENWVELSISNEVTSAGYSGGWGYTVGNSIRFCIEQEIED